MRHNAKLRLISKAMEIVITAASDFSGTQDSSLPGAAGSFLFRGVCLASRQPGLEQSCVSF
jgi:hypothetical protein